MVVDETEKDDDLSDELEDAEDITLKPGPNADSQKEIEKYIPHSVRELYDVYSYRHAASILATSFPNELAQIVDALLAFRITQRDIGMPGGNESVMPKKFSQLLRPHGWTESRVQGDLTIRLQEYDEKFLPDGKVKKTKRSESIPQTIKNFVDGHKIDYVKGRVAFDLEWNSKDQTFDRDLYAMRAFHECGLISAGVMVTRSEKLSPVFNSVLQLDREGKPVVSKTGKTKGQFQTVRAKYGASTTWIGKLLYRLNAGRHGGCPIIVFAITPGSIDDWVKK